MNNARLWCVVRPTVGIPLLLGGVVVASLSVHTAILSQTSWFEQFFNGEDMGPMASATMDNRSVAGTLPSLDSKSVSVGQDAVIVLPDGRTAHVTFNMITPSAADSEATLASLAAPAK